MGSSVCEDSPLIGATTYVERARWGVWDREATLLPRLYPDAIARGGGVPLLLPPAPGRAGACLSALDGLVVSGGRDVDPARYAAAPHPRTGECCPERDGWELELTWAALERGLPVLAICRGAQILNVATGGTLHQHQPEVVGHEGHCPGPGVFGRTLVRLDVGGVPGSVLGPEVEVRCHHHQAFDRVGRGLRVVGWGSDGSVEAVQMPGHRFVVGVQWHPEEDTDDVRLFRALAEAARSAGGVRDMQEETR